jgi:hypothetical protein
MGKRNDVYSTPGGIQEYFLHFLYYANRGNYFSKKTLNEDTRLNEWFVPKFGPIKFRIFIGLLFLPYTGMCISFTIIGSLLSPSVLWDRVIAICVIYALALGVSAHAADILGSKIKPWGNYLNKRQLWILIISGLIVAYTIGVYYIIFYVPLLGIVAILEGFFVFAYNLELFKGFFHNNFWFAISWGVLPLLAGFIMQTNSIGFLSIIVSLITGLESYIEIKTSRQYKELIRNGRDKFRIKKLETRLKLVSLGTIVFTIILVVFRLVAGSFF